MSDRAFLDSNILVYLYDHDKEAKTRSAIDAFSRWVAGGISEDPSHDRDSHGVRVENPFAKR